MFDAQEGGLVIVIAWICLLVLFVAPLGAVWMLADKPVRKPIVTILKNGSMRVEFGGND